MAVIFSVFKYVKEIKIKATTENSHINLQLAFTSIQNATKYRKQQPIRQSENSIIFNFLVANWFNLHYFQK